MVGFIDEPRFSYIPGTYFAPDKASFNYFSTYVIINTTNITEININTRTKIATGNLNSGDNLPPPRSAPIIALFYFIFNPIPIAPPTKAIPPATQQIIIIALLESPDVAFVVYYFYCSASCSYTFFVSFFTSSFTYYSVLYLFSAVAAYFKFISPVTDLFICKFISLKISYLLAKLVFIIVFKLFTISFVTLLTVV